MYSQKRGPCVSPAFLKYRSKIGRLGNLIWLFLLASASAYALPEFVSIQELAQGQALTGANLLNDSLYVNPAAGVFTNIYSIEGSYLLSSVIEASIVDTKTSNIMGGVGYFHIQNSPSSSLATQGAKIELATKLGQNIALGIDGKYIWGLNSHAQNDSLRDIDIGAFGNFSIFSLGLVLRNLIEGNSALLGQQKEWSFGGQLHYQNILFLGVSTFSTLQTFSPYQYGIGAEFVTPYYFSLKGGFRIQPQQSQSYWSGGLSFLSPRFTLTYAFQSQVQTSNWENMLSLLLLL